MDYRGSKSNIKMFVKEQRVDGSSEDYVMKIKFSVRCTLAPKEILEFGYKIFNNNNNDINTQLLNNN
jgi:hypothetical protein